VRDGSEDKAPLFSLWHLPSGGGEFRRCHHCRPENKMWYKNDDLLLTSMHIQNFWQDVTFLGLRYADFWLGFRYTHPYPPPHQHGTFEIIRHTVHSTQLKSTAVIASRDMGCQERLTHTWQNIKHQSSTCRTCNTPNVNYMIQDYRYRQFCVKKRKRIVILLFVFTKLYSIKHIHCSSTDIVLFQSEL
jgi:hypothetical protein